MEAGVAEMKAGEARMEDRRTRDGRLEKQEWKTGEAGIEGRRGIDRSRKAGMVDREDSDGKQERV
jgi:hypothetical protein